MCRAVTLGWSAPPLDLRNRLLDPNCVVLSDNLPEGGLDDAAANVLCANPEGCPACHSNDDLVFPDIQQLDAARVFLKEWTKNVVDDSLHRL